MQIFLTVLGYFFSISFFLLGVLVLFSSFLSGVLIIFGSFFIFPKFTNQIRKFFWAKSGKYLPKFSLAILSLVLIFSSILIFSNSSSQNVKKAEVPSGFETCLDCSINPNVKAQSKIYFDVKSDLSKDKLIIDDFEFDLK
jgi:Co/Zn/Cd efflux system component